jgi:DNA modification methylase
MPEELARRCVLAASRPGQEIIDCFGGAGTVGLVAAQNHRRAFLIELLEDHARIIRDRLGGLLG